eukprot:TRINITY_DN126495_c0_g1_i1.p1 TRINITY_DN126495_c0_g1~~TRINITY_DN126495_c0_g1_i1.p1  ORF type:complete len:391 (-),score=39.71 TRINITY_DN126495_c0_g1_i1:50-1189(-)
MAGHVKASASWNGNQMLILLKIMLAMAIQYFSVLGGLQLVVWHAYRRQLKTYGEFLVPVPLVLLGVFTLHLFVLIGTLSEYQDPKDPYQGGYWCADSPYLVAFRRGVVSGIAEWAKGIKSNEVATQVHALYTFLYDVAYYMAVVCLLTSLMAIASYFLWVLCHNLWLAGVQNLKKIRYHWKVGRCEGPLLDALLEDAPGKTASTTQSESINLRWCDSMMHKLWQDQGMSDCHVVRGSRRWSAHKCVLATASPVFATMLQSAFREAAEAEVDLSHLSEVAIESLMRFMYLGHLENVLDVYTWAELLVAADMYQFPNLTATAARHIEQLASAANIVELLRFLKKWEHCSTVQACSQHILDLAKNDKRLRDPMISHAYQGLV